MAKAVQLSGHEFEQTLGNSEGQGSLACCSLWDHKESHTAQRLNNMAVNIPPKHQILQNLAPAFCSSPICLKMSASPKLLWNPHCQSVLCKKLKTHVRFIQLFNEETNMVIKLVPERIRSRRKWHCRNVGVGERILSNIAQ